MKLILALLLLGYLYLLLFSPWKTQVQSWSSKQSNALWNWSSRKITVFWNWLLSKIAGKSPKKDSSTTKTDKPDPKPPVDNNPKPPVDNKTPKDKDKGSGTPKPTTPPTKGYDPDFTSSGLFQIRMDTLLRNHADVLAPLLTPEGSNKNLLHYTHFSVAMHKNRKMPLLTAVNIDGGKLVNIEREPDKWDYDDRMSTDYQLSKAVYAGNNLDLGHLVRRLDPVWGPEKVAAAANDETFHLTVCAPQHKNLNRKTWLQLEDYILKNTDISDAKVSVFTGPVFTDKDKPYRGALLPLQFWKMVAVIKNNGEPSVTAYLLSHADDLSDLKGVAGRETLITDAGFGEYKTFQIPLQRLQELTGLNLRDVIPYDPLKNRRATLGFVKEHSELGGAGDITI
jgi:endonuclease G, mitochondrial